MSPALSAAQWLSPHLEDEARTETDNDAEEAVAGLLLQAPSDEDLLPSSPELRAWVPLVARPPPGLTLPPPPGLGSPQSLIVPASTSAAEATTALRGLLFGGQQPAIVGSPSLFGEGDPFSETLATAQTTEPADSETARLESAPGCEAAEASGGARFNLGDKVEYFSENRGKRWLTARITKVDPKRKRVQICRKKDIWLAETSPVLRPRAVAVAAVKGGAGVRSVGADPEGAQPEPEPSLVSASSPSPLKTHEEKKLELYRKDLLKKPEKAMQDNVPEKFWRILYKQVQSCLERKTQASSTDEQSDTSELEAAIDHAEQVLISLGNDIRELMFEAEAQSHHAADRAAREVRVRQHAMSTVHAALADLQRYRAIHRVSPQIDALEDAEHLYERAVTCFSQHGRAFHQLGMLAANRKDVLPAALYWLRALLCTFPHKSAARYLADWMEAHIAPEEASKRAELWQPQPHAHEASSDVRTWRRKCISALFRVHLAPLFLEDGAEKNDGIRLEACGAAAQTALAESLLAVTDWVRRNPSSSKGAWWLMQLTIFSLCAVVYLAMGGKPASKMPTYRTAPTLTAVTQGLDSITGNAEVAWEALMVIARTLVEQTQDATCALWGPVALLVLMWSKLTPLLWNSHRAEELRVLLEDKVLDALAEVSIPEALDEKFAAAALPEDDLLLGILPLPVQLSSAAAPSSDLRERAGSMAEEGETQPRDGESSDDEVVLHAPVRRPARTARTKERPTPPTHVLADVPEVCITRLLRLRQLLGLRRWEDEESASTPSPPVISHDSAWIDDPAAWRSEAAKHGSTTTPGRERQGARSHGRSQDKHHGYDAVKSAVPATVTPLERKQLIVVDAANVAVRHGGIGEKIFSSRGIQLVIDYYIRRHHEVIAFLPEYCLREDPSRFCKVVRRNQLKTPDDIPLLKKLVKQNILVLTPPQDYDDAYIITFAQRRCACVVTNDLYRDYIEGAKDVDMARQWTKTHLISFTFIQDDFVPNPRFEMPSPWEHGEIF
eukprot:TRINITY_DN14416_c0_g1_i2.p1 TRINITY_DN14416_c0_g1~~TRINITY_DN14416_c0_g1_i2.p1  ORF type:complete len:1011 (+),score=206.55 TRINITY_DN14416_c0_g1_i2:53-3085(+)